MRIPGEGTAAATDPVKSIEHVVVAVSVGGGEQQELYYFCRKMCVHTGYKRPGTPGRDKSGVEGTVG